MFSRQADDARIARLEIRRREQLRTSQQPARRTADPVQALTEIERLAVIAHRTDGMQFTGPQRREVVHHRPRRSGRTPDSHDLIRNQTGLDTWLIQPSIDLQILVEKKISQHRDTTTRKLFEQFVEAAEFHRVFQTSSPYVE